MVSLIVALPVEEEPVEGREDGFEWIWLGKE